MKKQFLLLLLILVSAIQANGQILLFDYDESGNCVLKYRTVVVAPNGHAPAKPQTEQIGGHTLSVFPNPTYGLVRVEISGEMPEHPINVTLTDVNGKRLQNFTTESPNFDVDLTSYVQGNYLLLVLIDDKKSVWKIIKQ